MRYNHNINYKLEVLSWIFLEIATFYFLIFNVLMDVFKEKKSSNLYYTFSTPLNVRHCNVFFMLLATMYFSSLDDFI